MRRRPLSAKTALRSADAWAYRAPRSHRLGDAGCLLVAFVGLALIATPHVRQAAGEWRQTEIAAAQDREILTYRNALEGAYQQIVDPFEDQVVSFRKGATPHDGRTVAAMSSGDPAPAPSAPDPPRSMRIRIPAIGLSQAIVEGVSEDALHAGPGHYPGSAFPGQLGNMVISGHRTTYTRPFYYLDRLSVGDEILIDTPERTYWYRVERVFVVSLTNVRPLGIARYPKLTLTTCNPPGSAIQRLVVQARLASS